MPSPACTYINVDIHQLVEYIKDTVHICKTRRSQAKEIFNLLCKKYNLSLTFTPRVGRQIRIKVKRLLLKINTARKGGKQQRTFERWLIQNKCWNLKVLNSEFVYTYHKGQKSGKCVVQQIVRKYRRQSKSTSLQKYSRAHQYRLRSNLSQQCLQALEFIDFCGLQAETLTLKNKQSGKTETLNLSNKPESLKQVHKIIYIKDNFHISDQAYQSLALAVEGIPSLYKLKQHINNIPADEIRATPSQSVGYQRNITTLIQRKIEELHREDLLTSKEVHIKLSGDGTWCGRNIHVVNFSFTVIEEGLKAATATGNYLVSIFQDSEGYTSLCEHLADVRNDIVDLKQVYVDGATYNINFCLGGDYKFLLCCTGLDAASCTYSCLYCKCPSKEFHKSDIKWSMNDKTKGCRTVAEIEQCALLSKKGKKNNCSHAPIFSSIQIDNIVVDTLHMFLRTTDALMNLLILELRRADEIAKTSNCIFDREKHTHCVKLENFLCSIGITGFAFYVGQASKKLKWRTLTGPEKIKLCENVNIDHLLSDVPHLLSKPEDIQFLWDELYSLCSSLRSEHGQFTKEEAHEFELRSRKWLKCYTATYPSTNVTPYMHVLVNHVPELLLKFGSISEFTQQGLEKLNDITTKMYFRSTNHHRQDALLQLLRKRSRNEMLSTLKLNET